MKHRAIKRSISRGGQSVVDSTYLYSFIATLVVYVLSFFSPNNKIFIGVFVVYGLAMWIIHRNWKDALMFCYIASLPLAAGKKIAFDLVSFRDFNLLTFRPYGISADVIITIGDAAAALMALVIVKDMVFGRQWVKYKDAVATALLFFFGGAILATTLGSLRPELSMIHAVFLLKPLILYWYMTHHITVGALWKNAMYIIAAAIVLEFGVSAVQVMKQGPIGSVLELAPDYIPYDTSSDSGQIFRPVGTFYHANTMAHFLLPLLFSMLPFVFTAFRGMTPGIFITTAIVGMSVFMLTQSRSAWISFLLGFCIYIGLMEKVWNIRVALTKQAKRIMTWWIIPLAIVVLFFVLPRIANTSFTLDQYGSVQTRILLLQEAALAGRENPIFGVGLEMDLFFMYLRSVQQRVTNGVIFFFPEPVHNGYVRLFLQLGLVGSFGFGVAVLTLFREAKQAVKVSGLLAHRHVTAAMIGGIAAIAVNALMQPLLPNLHDIVLLIILSRAYYMSGLLRGNNA